MYFYKIHRVTGEEDAWGVPKNTNSLSFYTSHTYCMLEQKLAFSLFVLLVLHATLVSLGLYYWGK